MTEKVSSVSLGWSYIGLAVQVGRRWLTLSLPFRLYYSYTRRIVHALTRRLVKAEATVAFVPHCVFIPGRCADCRMHRQMELRHLGNDESRPYQGPRPGRVGKYNSAAGRRARVLAAVPHKNSGTRSGCWKRPEFGLYLYTHLRSTATRTAPRGLPHSTAGRLSAIPNNPAEPSSPCFDWCRCACHSRQRGSAFYRRNAASRG